MPRIARLDTPGLLHHIIIRGIERRRIFFDDEDRERFIEGLCFFFQKPRPNAMHGSSCPTLPTFF